MDLTEAIVNFKVSFGDFNNPFGFERKFAKSLKESLEILFSSIKNPTDITTEYYQKLKEACIVYDKQRSLFGDIKDETNIKKYAEIFLKEIEDIRYPKNNINSNILPKGPNKINFEVFLTDKFLLKACKTSFESGEYWDACTHAFRHLEERIRKKSGMPQNLVGVDLISECFGPDGKLVIPCCNGVEQEEEGFKLINLGIVKFHRNVKMHREGEINKELAMKIIGYVDYLLSILETARIRN